MWGRTDESAQAPAAHGGRAFELVENARFNLILVSHPQCNERWDFEHLAGHVHTIADDVQALVVEDQAFEWTGAPPHFARPTLTVSPAPLRAFRPPRGPVCQGIALPKSAEYAALERAGIPVPRWARLTRTETPDLSAFGPYVVVKPDRGGRGADVKIKRKGRVRWSQPHTIFAGVVGGDSCDWIVQEFVYTGPRPVSYRVATLFGQPLWAWKVEADARRRPLKHAYDFRGSENGGGMSIVSSGKGCVFSTVRDPELHALAHRAHQKFPNVAFLGVDIVREVGTGRLYVIEVNAVGFTWHLTSPIGRRIQCEFGFDLDREFDVRRRAARILAEEVRRAAR